MLVSLYIVYAIVQSILLTRFMCEGEYPTFYLVLFLIFAPVMTFLFALIFIAVFIDWLTK